MRVTTRAVEPDFKKSNKKPDAKVGYRRRFEMRLTTVGLFVQEL